MIILIVGIVSLAGSGGGGGDAEGRTWSTGGFDHQAHAVAGAAGYQAIDFAGEGSAVVTLDGSKSHSHFFDPGPPVRTGEIGEFSWSLRGGEPFASGPGPLARFPVGITDIGLLVIDKEGDRHTDYTNVTVRSSVTKGCYCYYYVVDEGAAPFPVDDKVGGGGAAPTFAEERPGGLAFGDIKAFPAQVRDGSFVARCVFTASGTGKKSLTVKHSGGYAKVLAGGVTAYDSSGAKSSSSSASVPFAAPSEVHVLFQRFGGGGVSLSVSGVENMQHNLAAVVPVLLSVSPASSKLGGGGPAKVVGIGLFNQLTIIFNDVELETKPSNLDTNAATFVVPSAATEGGATVSLRNVAGRSNYLPFTFSTSALPPLKFQQKALIAAAGVQLPKLITGIVYGPDHRWYVSSLDGHVYSFSVSRELVVSAVCKSVNLGKDRAAMAITFNPADANQLVYVSSSILYWGTKKKLLTKDAWTNGAVHTLKSGTGASCLALVENIITGLPVSNHDHGVNGLVVTFNFRFPHLRPFTEYRFSNLFNLLASISLVSMRNCACDSSSLIRKET